MEIKQYLKILANRWWIIAVAIAATLIPTFLMIANQPWVFESKASFVIRPRSSFAANEEEFVKAVDTLSRRVEINTTFAEIADSNLIKQRAIERLNLSPQDSVGLTINGKVRAGSNVLEIIAQGPNPGIVRDFAEAVSVETKEYISGLYDVFELEPLDFAKISNNPVSPNKALNLGLGGALGLLLGVSLVFLLEYFQEPAQTIKGFNVVDGETGLYNKSYFNLRVGQELSRTSNPDHSFSLAMIKINYRNRTSRDLSPAPALKSSSQLYAMVSPELRDEDILAHLGNSTFAFLMPNMNGKDSKHLFEEMHFQINSFETGNIGETIHCSIGIVSYDGGDATIDKIMTWVSQALEEAVEDSHGTKVALHTSSDINQASQKGANNSDVNKEPKPKSRRRVKS